MSSALGVVADTAAPISITSFGNAITQDFNTLVASGTGTLADNTPGGWGFAETGTNARLSYTAGTGSANAGDTYSFGSGPSDRALGGLQSGSLNPTIGARFANNTGGTITSLNISYTGEQWRVGTLGRADRIDFQISTTAAALNGAGFTDVNALDFSSPTTTGAIGGAGWQRLGQ